MSEGGGVDASGAIGGPGVGDPAIEGPPTGQAFLRSPARVDAEPFNLANLLTLSRIAFVPLVVATLLWPGRLAAFVAALFFIIASITDYLDGYFARRRNITSDLGRLLDPMADKLLVASALVMLVELGRAPGWVVVVILGREFAVSSLRGMATSKGFVLQASDLGKWKTVLQIVAVSALLIHYDYFGVDFQVGGLYFLWVTLVVTLWSGLEYFRRLLRQLV